MHLRGAAEFYLTGAVSSVERLISLTGFIQKLLGDIANNNFIPADHIRDDVFLIFVSTVFHCLCRRLPVQPYKLDFSTVFHS